MKKFEDNLTFEDIINQTFKEIKVGNTITGTIVDINANGEIFVDIGYKADGIIPRNEMDALTIDEFGITKSSICKNKVNQFVQFKVKQIDNENRLILSRKQVQEEALNWVKNDLK